MDAYFEPVAWWLRKRQSSHHATASKRVITGVGPNTHNETGSYQQRVDHHISRGLSGQRADLCPGKRLALPSHAEDTNRKTVTKGVVGRFNGSSTRTTPGQSPGCAAALDHGWRIDDPPCRRDPLQAPDNPARAPRFRPKRLMRRPNKQLQRTASPPLSCGVGMRIEKTERIRIGGTVAGTDVDWGW